MPPNQTRAKLEAEGEHGRGFRWIGIIAGLAVVGVAATATVGLAFPGLITTGALAIGLAGTTIVFGLVLLAALFHLDRAFSSLDRHHEAVVTQQQALEAAREDAWQRHEELREMRLGERIEELASRVDQLDAEHASLAQQSRRTSATTPFGDIHDLASLEGIPRDVKEDLIERGIEDTEQLWMANAKLLADHLDLDPRSVRRWQHQAELMALPSVGGRSAQILAASGVHTIAELAGWSPEQLTERLSRPETRLDTEPEEDLMSRSRIEAWIENARVHDPTAYRVHRRRGGQAASTSA